MTNEIERGDIFFFYRPKVGAERSSDVQRFYVVLANSSVYRLLILGSNRLPDGGDRSTPTGRIWGLVRSVSSDSSTLESILKGGEYETKTKGRRHLPPAAPVGEGRYAIVKYDGTTQLVFRLKRPKSGELAETLNLRQEASFIVAVKNPDISMPGFPDDKPDYPEQLLKHFQNRRWVVALNSGLLNYEGAQLAIIAGMGDEAAKKLGVAFDQTGDLEETIDLDLPQSGLLESRFPNLTEFAERHREAIETDIGAGGEQGGRRAVEASDSASAVARLLSGLEMPADKQAILDYARKNRGELKDPEPAMNRLEKLPGGSYETMPEIQRALAEATTEAQYTCEICGRAFENASSYDRHRETAHPESAVSAADLEDATRGVSYPADPGELAEQAQQNEADPTVLETIDDLPDREFRDAADLAVGFQQSVTQKGRKPKKAPSAKALESTSAAALAQALKGVDLPTRPDALREHAADNGADDSILELLGALPDRRYHDLSEVEKGFSEAK